VTTRNLRVLLTVLVVASAALFAIGVAIERDSKSGRHSETHASIDAGGFLLAADEHAGESPEHRAAEKQAEGAPKKHRDTKTPAKPESGEGTNNGEGGHNESGSGQEPAGGESAAHRASEANGERVFGIDIESTGLVVAAVAVSLLFAIALWLSESVLVPLALVGFALVAAVFDVREVFHQIDESRTNLTVIASIVAALHLSVVAGAAVLARRFSGRDSQVQQDPPQASVA
jgi:hypothetical protein